MASVVLSFSDVVMFVIEYQLIFYLIECFRIGNTSNKLNSCFRRISLIPAFALCENFMKILAPLEDSILSPDDALDIED